MPHPLEDIGRRLFAKALLDDQAGELLQCLYDGGAATIGPDGKLVFVTEDHLKQFTRPPEWMEGEGE